MRYRIALIAATMAAGACANLPATTTPDSRVNTATSSVEFSTLTTINEAATSPLGCEGDADAYRVDGPLGIVGGPGADAQLISGVRLVKRGECERFEVALSTDGGAPATSLPVAEVELIAASGVIRITFASSVTHSAITDSILEGTLIERAYVVRALDGSIFVDAHLSAAVAARTFVRQDPARVAVEVQPIASQPAAFPRVGGLVVVTGPTAGSIEYPITLTGYSRTFEANVIARLCCDTSGGVTQVATTAADYLELWGEFSITIDDGPGGDVTIFVGEDSPEDGTPIGVDFMFSAG